MASRLQMRKHARFYIFRGRPRSYPETFNVSFQRPGKIKNVNNNRKTIWISITVVFLTIAAATGLAIFSKPLYGIAILLGFALIVGFTRLLSQKDVWFKAKNWTLDVLFIALIVLLIILTIPFLDQPSPV